MGGNVNGCQSLSYLKTRFGRQLSCVSSKLSRLSRNERNLITAGVERSAIEPQCSVRERASSASGGFVYARHVISSTASRPSTRRLAARSRRGHVLSSVIQLVVRCNLWSSREVRGGSVRRPLFSLAWRVGTVVVVSLL